LVFSWAFAEKRERKVFEAWVARSARPRLCRL